MTTRIPSTHRRPVAPLVLPLVLLLATFRPAPAGAYTLPVEHQGGPRAAATFVEDHDGWHAGIDLPRTDGASIVVATTGETVFHAYPLGFEPVHVVLNDNPTMVGPWSMELSDTRQKYMLDILRVRRVTPGKPPISYQVQRVVETQPGIALDGVELVPGFPTLADSLVAGDQFEVDYAYYSARIFQTAHVSAGGEYHYYAHIDNVHEYVAWNTYPATAANRYYGMDSGVPPGRQAHVLDEGESFADIEQLLNFGSEPHHLHFSMANQFMFPLGTINPLSDLAFGVEDPQGNRPYVRSLALVYGQNQFIFAAPRVYGRVNILVEARDDMGSPEAADDGDGAENATREAGCYNAGYWVTADSAAGEDVASISEPNTMFAGPGKDTITGQDPLSVVLIPRPPFRIDINTNYHLVASHVEEDSNRCWNTRARKGGALNDGSDAPPARVNAEARFGDGRYTIHAKARDVRGYGPSRDSLTVVDNFRPFVRKVVVHDDGGELYSGEWNFDGTNVVFSHADPDDGMKDAFGRKRCADGQSDVVVDVTFSEGMKEAFIARLTGLDYTPRLRRLTPNQDSLWTATIPKGKLRTTREKAGRQTLEIFGTDWAENDVRRLFNADPFDPADNSRAGAVMQGPDGTDTLHRFAICQSLALVVDVTGSMYDEIEAVKEAMADVITYNEQDRDRYAHYNIVTFEDDVQVRLSSKDPNAARAVIGSLFAGFGGACPEASVSALDSLPPLMPGGGQAILATDADPLEGRPRLEAAKARLREKGIEVSVLLSGSCAAFLAAPGSLAPEAAELAALTRDNGGPGEGSASPGAGGLATIDARQAFHEMASATGGLYIESLPTAQFVGAARAITARYATGATLLSRAMFRPAPDLTVLPIPVDSSCAELLVLLNGSLGDATTLQLRRPSGAPVQLSDADVTAHFAPAVTVYRIAGPAVGAWSAEVTTGSGQGYFELSALARSPRVVTLGGAPNRRAGAAGPLTVTLDGPGTATAFRLIRADGSVEQSLTLFDDGLHEDGDAGDRTWGGLVTLAVPGEYRVALEGVDGAQAFTRETARTLVVGLPDLAGADTLDMGPVVVGRSATRGLYLQNVGNAPLVVGGVGVGSPALTAPAAGFTLPAGDAAPIAITWTPAAPGAFQAPVTVSSDDPDQPVATRVVRGRALAPALLAITPDTLAVSVPQGDSTTLTLRLRNLGAGGTTLALSDAAATTGPAPGGYRFQTSFGQGVPFQWETLGAGTQTVPPLQANGAAGPLPIGFEFPFFGVTATEFYISENGHLTLGGLPALGAPLFGACPPAAGYFAPYIAGYLADLDLRHGGIIRWHSNAERLVVEYQGARRFDLSELDTPLNGQIVLRRDGTIELNYETVPPGGSALVAVGSGAAHVAVSPSCQILDPARDRTTIRFWRDNTWLGLGPEADSLAAGDSLDVAVRVSARHAGFAPGQSYAADITLLNDALDTPRRNIPVRVTLLPGPYSATGRVTALEDGAPVPGAVVTAVGPYGSYADTTDAAGLYDLDGLPAGGYALTAISPLFLPSAPESLQVPQQAARDLALTRPVISLSPTVLSATVAAGDSVCLPLVVRNTGTAALVLDGLRRLETAGSANSPPGATLSEPDYERILEDPAADTDGPDLLALDAERTPTQLNFRLTLSDTLGTVPPQVFISLDTDRNPATGANPPALGYGLAGQNVGAEYELTTDNICAGYILLLDATDGSVLSAFFTQVEGRVVRFSVPLTQLGNDDGTANVCVTALPGICESGSTRPEGRRVVRKSAAPAAEAGTLMTDWMPEVGHGTVGACGWLSLVPSEATVAPGDSVTLAVCVDARALADTTVSCALTLESNDPRRPLALLPVSVVVSAASAAPEMGGTPGVPLFALRQNEPNPVRGATRIRFSLPRAERVRLSIFDLSGRLVWRPLDETRPAGPHELRLDAAERLAGGLYFYRLEAGERVATRKMLVIE